MFKMHLCFFKNFVMFEIFHLAVAFRGIFLWEKKKKVSSGITYYMYYKKYMVMGEFIQLNCLTPWSAGKWMNLIF